MERHGLQLRVRHHSAGGTTRIGISERRGGKAGKRLPQDAALHGLPVNACHAGTGPRCRLHRSAAGRQMD